MKLLADTGALLALVSPDDRHHAAAARFVKQHAQARFVLTDLVLVELTTRLRARVGAARAVAVAHDFLRSRRYEIVFADPPLIVGALDKMQQFGDKRLSLTDCASFQLMQQLGLEAAFAFDRDFRDCGFRMVP